jgi:hypothetical protein
MQEAELTRVIDPSKDEVPGCLFMPQNLDNADLMLQAKAP